MTTLFLYDNELGTPGNLLPDSANGPYRFEGSSVGHYLSDSVKGVFADQDIPEDAVGWGIQTYNPLGTYGVAFSEASPLSLVSGYTYYLGVFSRIQRIGGLNVWTNLSDGELYHFGKAFETRGSGFRWGIGCGGWYSTYVLGKFTYDVWCSSSIIPTCVQGSSDDHKIPNIYGSTYQCDYEKWYAVVIGIQYLPSPTFARIRLWINGVLITDVTECSTGLAGANIIMMDQGGTIAQPTNVHPAFIKQFDGYILVDDDGDGNIPAVLTSGGYLSDPEGGSSLPSLKGVRIVGGSVR